GRGGRVGFDSTPKTSGDACHGLPVRAWPTVLVMDEGVVGRVDGIEMG
ncbi:MAG: hypothetical protein JKY43_07860, partial [Phycisphaerales bacterium]|nr:hypothetical protein [Phycisphaerales bacterium]